eukprot:s494_g17.t1
MKWVFSYFASTWPNQVLEKQCPVRKEEKDEADEDRDEDDQGKWACSTACHSQTDTSYCASVVGQKAYSMCRSGSLKLPGFPSFESVVADLKKSANEADSPDFQVCVAVPNGLAIKQNLVDYWSGIDTFQLQVADLVEAHNKKYNPHGIKRGASDVAPAEGSSDWDMLKRTDVTFSGGWLSLSCGAFRLVYDPQQDSLWICGNDSKKRDSFEVKGPVELFGFGSGDFVEGPEAQDVQSDVTGRWLGYKVALASEFCILEPDRRLPQHIRALDIWGKVLTYKEAISELENAGEVNVKLSMHSIDKKEGSNDMAFTSQKKVCFVLDQPKEHKKKKASSGAISVVVLHCKQCIWGAKATSPTSSLLQRCELASSSEEKASEEKEKEKSAGKEKTAGKEKNAGKEKTAGKEKNAGKEKAKGKELKDEGEDEEAPPKALKKPASRKFKKDEFDELFDDFQRGNDGDNSDPDGEEGEGETEEKKPKRRRKKDDTEAGKKSKKKEECNKLFLVMCL